MRIDVDTQASIGFLIGALGLVEQLVAYQVFGIAPNDTFTYVFAGLAGGSVIGGAAFGKRRNGRGDEDA